MTDLFCHLSYICSFQCSQYKLLIFGCIHKHTGSFKVFCYESSNKITDKSAAFSWILTKLYVRVSAQ